MNDIYNMKLNQEIVVRVDLSVIRVPGGWLYITSGYIPQQNEWLVTSSVFVPFNNEFQDA